MTTQDLILGTVQLGVPYGIANRSGMPQEADAVALIRSAIEAGVTTFDTARAYGESEARIGKAVAGVDFKGTIITKLRPLTDLTINTPPDEIEQRVRKEIETSSRFLGQKTLDCLLLHRADYLTGWDGKVWQVLQALVRDGKIKRIGASVQSPDEAKLALETQGVSHIQLPLNMLDYRWREAGVDRLLEARPDITVHARSLYLQGLLSAGDAALFPNIEGVDAAAIIEALSKCRTELGRSSLADLCISWARSLGWVNGLVIGMETEPQLQDNVKLFSASILTQDERSYVETSLPRVPEALLNPALWPNNS